MDPEEMAKSIDDDQPTLTRILADHLIDRGYEVNEDTGPDWDALSPKTVSRIVVKGKNEWGYYGSLRIKDNLVHLIIYQNLEDGESYPSSRRIRGSTFNVHEKDSINKIMEIIDNFVGPDELESR